MSGQPTEVLVGQTYNKLSSLLMTSYLCIRGWSKSRGGGGGVGRRKMGVGQQNVIMYKAYWTAWMDEPSPFVVFLVAKYDCKWVSADKSITRTQF